MKLCDETLWKFIPTTNKQQMLCTCLLIKQTQSSSKSPEKTQSSQLQPHFKSPPACPNAKNRLTTTDQQRQFTRKAMGGWHVKQLRAPSFDKLIFIMMNSPKQQ
jgi:hypothetical protein